MTRPPRSRRAAVPLVFIGGLVILALAAIGAVMLMGGGESDSRDGRGDRFAVRRGSFDITIPASGELAALNQIEIRNQLENNAVITYIIEEGRTVKAGEVLIRLNEKEISDKIRDAQDDVNVAENARNAAEAELQNQISTRESELAKADLAILLADLALMAWEKGDDIAKRNELTTAVSTSQKDYDRLVARYIESEKLLAQQFISLDEYKRDEIAMIEAKAKRDQSTIDLEVYEKYLNPQERATKESDCTQAKDERDRVKKRLDAEVLSAQSDRDSKTFQLESAQIRLADLQKQLQFCTITAPTDGLVVYYSSLQTNGWGRNEGQPPQVGTSLSRNEPVIILPDTSQILANVKVNESLSGVIAPGQRVVVTSDAVPDTMIHGEVLNVGVLAETGGWRDPNRRDYTVRVLLENTEGLGLKPSMRCKAEIYVGSVNDSLHVPIQAVFRDGATAYVYAPASGGYAQKPVTLGRSSELFIEVAGGLNEGDAVLLREPRAEEVVARLPSQDGPGERGPRGGPAPENGAMREHGAAQAPAAESPDSPSAAPEVPAATTAPTVD